jgi:hypothetical protein
MLEEVILKKKCKFGKIDEFSVITNCESEALASLEEVNSLELFSCIEKIPPL